MKKILISVISACLALILLTGCTPAAEVVPATTTEKTGILLPEGGSENSFTDFVVCSETFSLYMGEYYYFFMTILSSTADDLEKKYGVDLDKSLKEQYIGDSNITWFDAIRDEALNYMKTLLFVYEKASAADRNYKKTADEYLNNAVIPGLKQISGGDPSGYINEQYGGAVSYQNYLNALYLEYIYNCYLEDLINAKMGTLTEDEIRAYADRSEGEKDETPVRTAIYVRVPDGKNKANAFLEGFGAKEEKTAATFESLAKESGYVFYTDSFVPEDETLGEISEWLYGDGRVLGDVGAVEVEGDAYYAVFYFEDGEAVYLYEAKLSLSLERATDEIKSGVAAYSGFRTDSEKLDSVNA